MSEDLLADDSPLLRAQDPTLEPGGLGGEGAAPWDLPPPLAQEPLPTIGGSGVDVAASQPEASPVEEDRKVVNVTFAKAGPLGIEFERLAAPYVVEQLHAGGLAFGSGLEPGHRLVTIDGEAVDSMMWDDLKERLQKRPSTAIFEKVPNQSSPTSGGAALFSGFAGAMRSIGGGVAQQGFGFGTKLGSAGLDLGSKLGASGLDLGSRLGSSGLGELGTKVGGAGLGFGSVRLSGFSGLLSTVQDSLAGGDTPSEGVAKPAAAQMPDAADSVGDLLAAAGSAERAKAAGATSTFDPPARSLAEQLEKEASGGAADPAFDWGAGDGIVDGWVDVSTEAAAGEAVALPLASSDIAASSQPPAQATAAPQAFDEDDFFAAVTQPTPALDAGDMLQSAVVQTPSPASPSSPSPPAFSAVAKAPEAAVPGVMNGGGSHGAAAVASAVGGISGEFDDTPASTAGQMVSKALEDAAVEEQGRLAGRVQQLEAALADAEVSRKSGQDQISSLSSMLSAEREEKTEAQRAREAEASARASLEAKLREATVSERSFVERLRAEQSEQGKEEARLAEKVQELEAALVASQAGAVAAEGKDSGLAEKVRELEDALAASQVATAAAEADKQASKEREDSQLSEKIRELETALAASRAAVAAAEADKQASTEQGDSQSSERIRELEAALAASQAAIAAAEADKHASKEQAHSQLGEKMRELEAALAVSQAAIEAAEADKHVSKEQADSQLGEKMRELEAALAASQAAVAATEADKHASNEHADSQLSEKIQELEAALAASQAAEADNRASKEQEDSQLGEKIRELESALGRAEVARKETQDRCALLDTDLLAKREELERLASAQSSAAADAQGAEAQAEAAAAEAERRVREEQSAGFEARIQALARQHEEEVRREKEAWDGRRKEALALESSLEALRRLREEEGANAKKELEQFRFALCQKDQQLAEKIEYISTKDEEVKSLLKQLATVPTDQFAGFKKEPVEEALVAEAPAATVFEVMFALEGPLGLEFRQLSAPYVVAKVHPDRVATDLGILPGDVLMTVAEDSVTEAPWEVLVKTLSVRPVVARFRRDPKTSDVQEGSLLSSVSSKGSSMFTAAAKRAGDFGAGGRAAEAGAASVAEAARLQADVERLGTFLRARDAQIEELNRSLRQQQEALRVLEGGSVGAADVARLAQEKEAQAQQLQQVQAQLAEVQRAAQALEGERARLTVLCAEEARQKEVHRQESATVNERCGSLMTQFESLRNTCQSLSLDSQQKAEMELQVQELSKMNAQWQQVHQSLSSESELLRQRANEVHQLTAEVSRLRQFEQGWAVMEGRLQEAEARVLEAGAAVSRHEQDRLSEHTMIQRLQGELESMQESGEFEAGHLESELLERNRECASLRRDSEELKRRLEELLRVQRDCQEAADAGRALRSENEELRRDLTSAKQEQEKLTGVVERCLDKMENESRERPHLVDKRMVTQMVAAFLEQRDHPRAQQEILTRMADLLGFTTAEREQVGLSQKRRTLLEQQEEATGLNDLTDRFVDFLFEESEG